VLEIAPVSDRSRWPSSKPAPRCTRWKSTATSSNHCARSSNPAASRSITPTLFGEYAEILQGRDAIVVANLPYNVATPLVLHLLESEPLIRRMLVMVQKEVGERFAAHAGDEAYGAASLRLQYFADARVVGKVSPTVFLPKPNVESALVSIIRRPKCASIRHSSAKPTSSRSSARPSVNDERCCADRSRVGRVRGSSNAPTSPRRDDRKS